MAPTFSFVKTTIKTMNILLMFDYLISYQDEASFRKVLYLKLDYNSHF